MSNYSVHKASELASDERVLVERWLGRPLAEDESVSLNAIRPHGVPSELERAALRHEIVAQAEEIGSRAPETGEEEARALVEDALAALRGGRG